MTTPKVVIQEISGNPTAEEEAIIRAVLEKLVNQRAQSKPANSPSKWVRYHRLRGRSHHYS